MNPVCGVLSIEWGSAGSLYVSLVSCWPSLWSGLTDLSDLLFGVSHWPVCGLVDSYLTVLLIVPVCVLASLTSLYVACITDRSLVICLNHQLVVCEGASLVVPVWEVLSGVVGNSSGKSQKPLYSKQENYPKTQDKYPTSILRLLPSYTSTKVVSGVSSKGKGLYYQVKRVKRCCYDK